MRFAKREGMRCIFLGNFRTGTTKFPTAIIRSAPDLQPDRSIRAALFAPPRWMTGPHANGRVILLRLASTSLRHASATAPAKAQERRQSQDVLESRVLGRHRLANAD